MKKCHYCDFVITTDLAEEKRRKFLSAIGKEILHAKTLYGPLEFETLYLGGGTPSVLTIAEMGEFLSMLRSAFRFRTGYEFTCEINPDDANPEKFDAYRRLGINRASIGAQAFQDQLLQDMGRAHHAAQIRQTLDWLRAAGFNNISLDLILRLPGQTPADLEESVERAIESQVSQVVLYDLDIHEKTVYGARRRRGDLRLPEEDEHFQMASLAADLLESAGFEPYEVTTFAKPGFESRHNLGYWNNREYLGLGPGAFSYMEGVRYQQAPDVRRYLEKIEAGDWRRDSEDRMTPEKRERETLLTGLRLKEGVDLSGLHIIRESLEESLARLKEAELIEQRESRIALTRQGRLLFETVLRELA